MPEPAQGPARGTPSELLKIRRGLGLIYILAGLIHAGEMVLATLYSQGRLYPLYIKGRLWSEMYYAHFLFLVGGAMGYLFLSYRQTRIFYYETLVDFLVGIPVFIVLISFLALLLVRGAINPWLSLLPSLFQVAYGFGLRQGRAYGFGPKSSPPL